MIKHIFLRAYIISAQFGIDVRRCWRSFRGMPAYLREWVRFRRHYTGRMTFMPSLHDRFEDGGDTKSEYFWQDLLVARWIFEANPQRHLDVGSRVDGFVAHVASFREIEVLDIRPIPRPVPGVVFRQADLMQPVPEMEDCCDSLSCLHALEHFGLGRYGDPIAPDGHVPALKTLASMLRKGGMFYLGVPVGVPRVEFNANRVFDPNSIINLCASNDLALQSLTVVRPGDVKEYEATDTVSIADLATYQYNLGIFRFKKLRESDNHLEA
jgi:hypothetical protein